MRRLIMQLFVGAASIAALVNSVSAENMGTAYTYQGRLEQNDAPVNDFCDFRFGLWDAETGGMEIGISPQSVLGVMVLDGIVIVTGLDFGPAAIDGTARWLEVEVKCLGDIAFVLLTPRVKLNPAPHALALPGLYTQQNATSPNLIGGYHGNTVSPGAVGATISGGGGDTWANSVTGEYGTIGGGQANTSGAFCTVGGGLYNTASNVEATVGGGIFNWASAADSTVSGGAVNTSGNWGATVCGGAENTANGYLSTVTGGWHNLTEGQSSVVGGEWNVARGKWSTVPGGFVNWAGGTYSFAAGHRAMVRDASQSGDPDGDEGTFAWGDSAEANFVSTGPNQFLIRASGGVGIGTNAPTEQLDVAGNIRASGTIHSGNSITIDGTAGSENISSTADLEIRVADGRALRIKSHPTSPNIIGGYSGNTVYPSHFGATIAGGGAEGFTNTINGAFGTIGGGRSNTAGDHDATVGGGWDNTASAQYSTVGGGLTNTAAMQATVAGGTHNTASGNNSTVGGGWFNVASGEYTTIGGGNGNSAVGRFDIIGGGWGNTVGGENATIGGGYTNLATGVYATIGGGRGNWALGVGGTVPGGEFNQAGGNRSFAAGYTAIVRDAGTVGDSDGDEGTFVWSDTLGGAFTSTGPNQFLIRAAGGVGIGTNSPAEQLDVAGNIHASGTVRSGSSVTIDGTAGSEKITSTDDLEIHVASGRALRIESNPNSPNIIAGSLGNVVTVGNYGSTIAGGGAEDIANNTVDGQWGTVGGGLGNSALGHYATVGGGLFNTAIIGSTVSGGSSNSASGYTAAIGGGFNNIASGPDATIPGGYSNQAGGQHSFAAGLRAKVRDAAQAGDSDGDEGTFAWADSTEADFVSTGPNQFLIRASGGVGIGNNTPSAQLDVEKSSATVAVFNRTTDDGTVIEIQQDGVAEGTISVSGNTVSYNAFTGSHYGTTEESLERGMLVTMNGRNRRVHGSAQSEPIYGIAATTTANDPRCLGAYLGVLEPKRPTSDDNPHQIMAVGNGEMWIVDTGRDIAPGDSLISSDMRGHAMMDDETRFAVGHVIARAAEPVAWDRVTDRIEGRRRARISVFFESFERGSAAIAKLAEQNGRLDERNTRLEQQNRELEARLAALEQAVIALASPRGGGQ